MKQKILFLDRDGTLIKEPSDNYQVDSFEKLEFLPEVIYHLKDIVDSGGYLLVMITNQDGLGTESFPEEDFWPPHDLMMKIFEKEGIQFHEVLIDRTFKADGAPTRKPGTGLLTHYMDGTFDLTNSFVIGDRHSDILLAKNLGAKGIMLGKSEDHQDDLSDMQQIAGTLVLETTSWSEIKHFLVNRPSLTKRTAIINRSTKETKISIALELDGEGKAEISTGIGFFDHMLHQLVYHSGINLRLEAIGDLVIDPHHTIEDTAIALGEAFLTALGDKKGIERYGFWILPMDEAKAEVAIDFSGRNYLAFDVNIPSEMIGEMPSEMVEHFFYSFASASKATLHISANGQNSHHIVEAVFKGIAKSIGKAINLSPNGKLASTKGML